MLDKTIDMLKRKQKYINGLVRMITAIKLLERFPVDVVKAIQGKDGDASRIYQNESFATVFKQSVLSVQLLDEDDEACLNQGMLYLFGILAIANCTEQDDRLKGVQVVDAVFKTILEAEQEENPQVGDEVVAEMFLDIIREMVDDEEGKAILEQYKTGSAEYVIHVIEMYCKNIKTRGK